MDSKMMDNGLLDWTIALRLDNGMMDWTMALRMDNGLMDWTMALWTRLEQLNFVLVILNFALFVIWTKL
jgi:hypothetical protein